MNVMESELDGMELECNKMCRHVDYEVQVYAPVMAAYDGET